ncbi:hypothetical protein [Crocosphaera sp. XPORK-15E]|uniref:hypothetical protein n=1 Tax=Crocosphaera sp. XPORK-15E TaxID=3110247 RepID=UPI002B208E71|nr:hypothetical protein [Crocosphaera sp. XPORK-15E]MEA5532980.1 hypothetical protein [Crocosphaera sp. XPORK-15E]
MKAAYLGFVTILSTVTLTVPISIMAQDPPAETYQPGFWQPVARFDPKKPVEVKLINKTELSLEYDLTDVEFVNPDTLSPGETGILKNFGNSAYIVVYTLTPPNPETPFTLKFNIDVTADNIVTVTIEKAAPNFFGHRTFNLQKTGAIFVY